MSYGRIFGAFVPAPSRAILANFGAPAKICEVKFCGEEEKVWRSSRQSCLQDCTMNSRTFDEATRIGLEPTTPSVTGWCSNQLSYRAMIAQVRAASYRGNVLYYIGKSACCQAQICGKCNFLQKRAKKQNAQVPKNLCVMAGVVSFELTARGFGDRCSTS